MRLHRLIPILYPPRSISFSSSSNRLLEIGDVLRESRRFSASDVAKYSEVTGDRNPVHLDADFSRRVAGFEGGSIVHGMLVASLIPSVIAAHFPGAIYTAQNLKFKLPVYVGEEVITEIQATYMKASKNRYMLRKVYNQMLDKSGLSSHRWRGHDHFTNACAEQKLGLGIIPYLHPPVINVL